MDTDVLSNYKFTEKDTYDLCSTLAPVLANALKAYKRDIEESDFGFFHNVDDDDMPANVLEKSQEVAEEKEYKTHYILDEMIWAFENYDHWYDEIGDMVENDLISEEEYGIRCQPIKERMNKALALFGKYYNHLWR